MVQSVYRNSSGQWMCCADTVPGPCPDPATMQWFRCADGNSDGSETVPVMACDTHALSDDVMALVHQDSCAAPATCTCIPFTPVRPAIVRAGG
jgi:hypothetical protein